MSDTPELSTTPIEPWEVLDLLTSLVQKSLVVYEEDPQGQGRYRLLETVRQYARDRLLEASGETDVLRRQHAQFFLALAEEAEPKLSSPAKREWLQRLEEEHGNLRAALQWCHDQSEETETELRLAAALWWFWSLRDYNEEGYSWLTRALARSNAAERTAARAQALCGAGVLAMEQRDAAGCSLLEESIAIWREVGDQRGLACSLRTQAGMMMGRDHTVARRLLEESMAICEAVGDRWGLVPSLWHLGRLAFMEKEFPAARARYQETAAVAQEVGDQWNRSWALCGLGEVAREQQDLTAAQAHFAECLEIQRQLGTKASTVFALEGLARVARQRGEYAAARSYFEEALAIWRDMGNEDAIARTLLDLGTVAT